MLVLYLQILNWLYPYVGSPNLSSRWLQIPTMKSYFYVRHLESSAMMENWENLEVTNLHYYNQVNNSRSLKW